MNIPTFIRSLNAENITPQQLKELQQNNSKSLLLIDVRSPEEYQEKHIEESILIPITDIESGFGIKQIQDLIAKKQEKGTVVLYCTTAVRSFKAYEILKKQGINTSVLKGGIEAWQKQ
jgi:adenylyltransferase/sulfurtransferase